MGIAPRRLDGWSPKRFVEHVYDDEGRLIRSVEFVEPEFSIDDVGRLIAARRLRNVPRGPHGHPIQEATSRDSDPSSHRATHRYVVSARRDFAQQSIVRAQEEWKKSHPDTDMTDMIFTANRVPVVREEVSEPEE